MSPQIQRRLANTLIVLGVLAWVPYFYFLARGETPSILPYLAGHLTGVLSGAWLRTRNAAAGELSFGQRRKLAARILIILGILAWAPYFYLSRIGGIEVEIGPFLGAHLTGVLGGSLLRISVEVERLMKRTDANGGQPTAE
ncbi:MAG: hypothetical protein WBR18_02385 [Anaerolineales bacterium]